MQLLGITAPPAKYALYPNSSGIPIITDIFVLKKEYEVAVIGCDPDSSIMTYILEYNQHVIEL